MYKLNRVETIVHDLVYTFFKDSLFPYGFLKEFCRKDQSI